VDRKFNLPNVLDELAGYGFVPGNYHRIIVTWGSTTEAKESAAKQDIELWDFRDLLEEIADAHGTHRHYFTDDTARTIQLYAMASSGRKSK
jgi:hypothetical protein